MLFLGGTYWTFEDRFYLLKCACVRVCVVHIATAL